MTNARPPRLSTWLAERLTPLDRRQSVIGDLLEQLHCGRSVWWYRRQVAGTILAGLAADIAAHKLLAIRSLVIGWSAMYLVYQFLQFVHQTRVMIFGRWGSTFWGDSEVLRQLWVYYGLPFQLVTCLLLMTVGWMVARLHRRRLPGIVIVFSATLLIPGVLQALETRRMLQTPWWPGWGWGSFRWALVYYVVLSLVVYPLCVIVGGLCGRAVDPARALRAE